MIVAMKARSNLRQPILTILALLIPVAIFIAAAPTNSPNINSLKPAPPIPVAFVLARTGLLDGKSATTFHAAFNTFAMQFPKIELKRGARFVENGNLATAGGLSSGIDLALRVVERYYGRDVAQKTAYNMEYQGQGWMNADSNQVYATTPVSTAEHPLCPVCG